MTHETRLNTRQLESLDARILRPEYERNQAAAVVHLGVGAFHRAHQAVYFDSLLGKGETDWMIRGASLRSETAAKSLNPQDGLFTLRVTDDAQDRLRIIGSIKTVIAAKLDKAALISHLAAPETKLVTLTITEKGYYVNIASKTLIEDAPDIQHDIANPNAPVTAAGFLVASLAARREAGLAPFTVLSCDNLPHNGEITRIAVISLAERISPDLARWIDNEGAFPSSMVDRIVPSVALHNIAELANITGQHDAAMVKTEPFSQWVIEDKFCNDRPKLDQVGAEFTHDVSAWETLKLRMLNGAHSALAYMGSLAGHTYVSGAVGTAEFETFINKLWDEIEVTLPAINGFSVQAYRRDLFARFQNSTLKHKTHQIAMDGSQKIPQRILAPLYERRGLGLDSPALMTALASWIKYQRGVDDLGASFSVHDPMQERLQNITRHAGADMAALVASITSIESIFGSLFAKDKDMMGALRNEIEAIS